MQDCTWQKSNSLISEIEVDNYLSTVKYDQLKHSKIGDYLWDFSCLTEKQIEYDEIDDVVDTSPINKKYSRSAIAPQRTNQNESKKSKLVCVTTANRIDTRHVDLDKEEIVVDFSILRVFDGEKVNNNDFYLKTSMHKSTLSSEILYILDKYRSCRKLFNDMNFNISIFLFSLRKLSLALTIYVFD